jgi:DNA replication initiation complex subunit (GINS family)
MNHSFVHVIRDVYIAERDIPQLSNQIPRDFIKKYNDALNDLKAELLRAFPAGNDGVDDIMAREESLRYSYNDLMLLRVKKIIALATSEAETGTRSDITGALPHERENYHALVTAISVIVKESGVKPE